jgi:hypothetical protein
MCDCFMFVANTALDLGANVYGNFFTSRAAVIFSRRTLLHGLSSFCPCSVRTNLETVICNYVGLYSFNDIVRMIGGWSIGKYVEGSGRGLM